MNEFIHLFIYLFLLQYSFINLFICSFLNLPLHNHYPCFIAVFTSIPYDTTIDAGTSLLWNCAASGTPTPVIRWLRKGAVLQSGKIDRLTILPNNSLRITGVRLGDHGSYQCRASIDSIAIAVQAVLTVQGTCLSCLLFKIYLWESCVF